MSLERTEKLLHNWCSRANEIWLVALIKTFLARIIYNRITELYLTLYRSLNFRSLIRLFLLIKRHNVAFKIPSGARKNGIGLTKTLDCIAARRQISHEKMLLGLQQYPSEVQRAPVFEGLQSSQLFTSPITINFHLPAPCAHVNPWKTRKRLRITHKAITRNLYTRRSSTWVYGTLVSARARVHERRRHFVCFCFTSHPTVPPLYFQPRRA